MKCFYALFKTNVLARNCKKYILLAVTCIIIQVGLAQTTPPGNTLSFGNGTSSLVTIANKVANDFTIEFWMNTTQEGDSTAPATEWYNGTGLVDADLPGLRNDFGMSLLGNRICFGTGGTSDISIISHTIVNTGKWVHVAAVRSQANATISLYINGVLDVTSASGTATLSDPTIIDIGANTYTNPPHFTGSMDELRFFTTDRSASVQADMLATVAVNATGLVSYYKFDQGTAGGVNSITTLLDATSQANNGTMTGFTETGSTSNFVESYAMVIPTDSAASTVASTSFVARWGAPTIGQATDYFLDVSTSSSFSSFVTGYNELNVTGGAISQQVTGLATGTAYYYRVRADKSADAAVKGLGSYSISSTTVTTLGSPSVTSFLPTSAAGGQPVTITGTNFTGATAVYFGGTAAASFTVVSATSITAVPGMGTSGIIKVVSGTASGSLAGFTFLPPAITSFTPTATGIDSVVTITGANFTSPATVKFGSTAALSATVVNTTTITAIVGAGASGNIIVTTPGGSVTSTGAFTWIATPVITSFTPTSASPGGTVTLTGTNFTSPATVTFGGVQAASATVVNTTTITAVVGSGAAGYVRVRTPGGADSLAGFTVKPPIITSFTPTSSGDSATVTITGTNFTSPATVTFGGVQALLATVVNTTTITAIVGNGAAGYVRVTTAAGTDSLAGFTIAPPTITTFTPKSAGAGTTVTITGTNLYNASQVSFGGIPATVVGNTATSITATVGSGAAGYVRVTTPGGVDSVAGFTIPKPTIKTFSPLSGGIGYTITIIGQYFTGATAVKIGGTAAASFTVVSDDTITAVAGNGTTGLGVSVTTPAGSVTSSKLYTFNPPVIKSFTPFVNNGGTITITGQYFTGATDVLLLSNSHASAAFTVVSDSVITAVASSTSSTGPIEIDNPTGYATTTKNITIGATITSFSPAAAYTGETVAIKGLYFTNHVQSIAFGGVAATSFTVVSDSVITAVMGNGASGNIVISGPPGSDSIAGFTFLVLPTVTYGSAQFNFTKGLAYAAATAAVPVTTGSDIVFTISPTLPAGLQINDTTGIITGTPTILSAQARYTITATNAAGPDTTTIQLAVNDLRPLNFNYATPVVYTKDSTVNPLTPTIVPFAENLLLNGLSQLNGVAVATNGTIYLSRFEEGIETWLPGGTLAQFGDVSPTNQGITLDAAGNLYVSLSSGYVQEFSPAGKQINYITTGETSATNPYAGQSNTNVAVDAAGNVYVTFASFGVVEKITPGGIISNIGSGLVNPSGVAADAAGNIYVSDANAVYKIAVNGTQTLFAAVPDGVSISIDAAGNMFVDQGTGNITEVFANGGTAVIGNYGGGFGGAAVDTRGNLYVSNYSNGGAYEITLDGGTATAYTISPALPAGLALNPANGTINGTPTAVAAEKTYTITATNTGGSTTDTLQLTVIDVPPATLAYSGSPFVYVTGTAITPLTPTTTGGTVTAYSIRPALPAGLVLDTAMGIISGTPNTITALATYTVTGSNGFGKDSTKITITVNGAAPSLSYAGSPYTFNKGSAIAALTPSVSGTPVISYSIMGQSLPAGLTLNGATGAISGTPTAISAQSTYTIKASNSWGSNTAVIIITVTASTWTGTVSTAWNTAGNWSGNAVPGSASDAIIPAGTLYSPLISNSAHGDSVNNLTIAAGAILTISNNDTLSVLASISNSDTIKASAGAINMIGSAPQTMNGVIYANNLIINNSAGVTITGGSTKVLGIYTPVTGTLHTGGYLVLASTPTGTANVASGTGTYVSGNVVVQRYIPAHRAWRFLTAPLSSGASIFSTWENGGNVNDSTGVAIWSPNGNISSNGITKAGAAPSMEYFDPTVTNGSGGAWVGLTNTYTTTLDGSTASAANKAFGVFVTGPFGSGRITPAEGDTSTTLLATGQLQTGQQVFNYSNIPTGNYILAGNPYASPVNFTHIGATGAASGNILNTMWAWDAQRLNTSYGGYVTFSWDAATGTYDQDIDASQTAQTDTIQSGQAFFVEADTSSAASTYNVAITFNESDKAIGKNLNTVFGVTLPASQLRIALNRQEGSNMQPVDGVLVKYGSNYKAGVSDDANKLYNYDENFALRIGNNYLAIERRPLPQINDTLFLDIYALKQNTNYSFTIIPQNINLGEGIQPYLVDTYLNTKTPISFASTNTVSFNTTGVAGSFGETRFIIVFSQTQALATTITNVKAWPKDKGVQVEWTVATEQGTKDYIVEKSADGITFATTDTTAAIDNNQTETYDWFDASPFDGNNYYRIKVINKDGSGYYSNVVMVNIKLALTFKAYPNPLPRGEQLRVEIGGMPVGKYTLQIFSNDGKQVMQKIVLSDGNLSTQNVNLPPLAAGIYQVILVDEAGKTWKQQLVVN